MLNHNTLVPTVTEEKKSSPEEKNLNYWRQKLAAYPLTSLYSPKKIAPERKEKPMVSFSLDASLTNLQGYAAAHFVIASFYVLLYRYTNQFDLCMDIDDQPIRLKLQQELSFLDLLKLLETELKESADYTLPITVLKEQKIISSLVHIAFDSTRDLKTFQPTRDYFSIAFCESTHAVVIHYNPLLFTTTYIHQLVGHWQALITQMIVHPNRSIVDFELMLAEERQLIQSFNETTQKPVFTGLAHELFVQQASANPDRPFIVFHQANGEKEVIHYGQANVITTQLAHSLMSHCQRPPSKRTIGLCLTRSLYSALGFIAIFKAAGIAVPLEINSPELLRYKVQATELDVILVDNKTISYVQASLPNTHIILINVDAPLLNTQLMVSHQDTLQPAPVEMHFPAYIMFTSGTSGKPKGVMVPHSQLNNQINALYDRQLKPYSKVICTAPVTFDAFLFELFEAIVTGGSSHIIYEEGRISSQVMARVIKNEGIGVATFLPLIFKNLNPAELRSLYHVITMGDMPDEKTIPHWKSFGIEVFNEWGVTEAGPCNSRNPADQTAVQLPLACIGGPLRNQQLLVINSADHVNENPPGIPGQIVIANVEDSEIPSTIALGYLNNPVLTQKKFPVRFFNMEKRVFDHPIQSSSGLEEKEEKKEALSSTDLTTQNPSTNQNSRLASSPKRKTEHHEHKSSYKKVRLYLTGDRGVYYRYNDQKQERLNIVFLGREDGQIKFKGGNRTEIRGIINTIKQHPDVKDAHVLPTQNKEALLAFVELNNRAQPMTLEELHKFFQTLDHPLDRSAWPQAVYCVPQIPMTNNSKVDEKSLLLFLPQQASKIPPNNPLQEKLQTLLADVLGISPTLIGMNYSITELGGTSIHFSNFALGLNREFRLTGPINITDLSTNITLLQVEEMVKAKMIAEQASPTFFQASEDDFFSFFPFGNDVKTNTTLSPFPTQP